MLGNLPSCIHHLASQALSISDTFWLALWSKVELPCPPPTHLLSSQTTLEARRSWLGSEVVCRIRNSTSCCIRIEFQSIRQWGFRRLDHSFLQDTTWLVGTDPRMIYVGTSSRSWIHLLKESFWIHIPAWRTCTPHNACRQRRCPWQPLPCNSLSHNQCMLGDRIRRFWSYLFRLTPHSRLHTRNEI